MCSVDDCDRTVTAKGLCGMHYTRRRLGKPLDTPDPSARSPYTFIHPGATATLEYRLWKRVVKTDTCWLWTGGGWKFGHGGIRVGGQGTPTMGTHVVSYMLANPAADLTGKFVLHHCDVPNCVRPEHLYLGTQSDNMRDRATRLRNTALTVHQIAGAREAMRNGMAVSDAADAYNMTRSQAYGIRSGAFAAV